MASDRRYKEIVPESIRRFEADHFDQPSDWYIRPAANVGVYEKRLEELYPSTLLEGDKATEAVQRMREAAKERNERNRQAEDRESAEEEAKRGPDEKAEEGEAG